MFNIRLKKINYSSATILFVAFFTTLFIKNILFHYFLYKSILCSSIVLHPKEALVFYLPKLILPLLIASFVFVTKKKWWTILVVFLMDIWCISNVIFFRANDLLLNIEAIGMLGNLSGFEASLETYFLPMYFLLPLTSVAYLIIMILLMVCLKHNELRNIKSFALIAGFVVLLHFVLCIPQYKEYIWVNKITGFVDHDVFGSSVKKNKYGWLGLKTFLPFNQVRCYALPNADHNPHYGYTYAKAHSIIDYLGAVCVYELYSKHSVLRDIEVPAELFSTVSESHQPKNIIFVLVESFESWALNTDGVSENVIPNFKSLSNSEHSLLFTKIKSEALYGGSGDGQMIVTTGLLPTEVGAACLLYGDNEWPSIVTAYEHSVFIDIANGVWNQRQMTKKYGYKTDLYSPEGKWTDATMFEQMENVLDTIREPFFVMGLTEASHTPFQHKGTRLKFKCSVPPMLMDYLDCLHYTDSCFGVMWNRIKDHPKIQNSVIVITGDHTVFKSSMLSQLPAILSSSQYVSENESYCPLIVYSKKIDKNQIDTGLNYQMDIYPTLLYLADVNHYWKGVGINLADFDARSRKITEEKAYMISDKIIRTDYLKTLQINQGKE